MNFPFHLPAVVAAEADDGFPPGDPPGRARMEAKARGISLGRAWAAAAGLRIRVLCVARGLIRGHSRKSAAQKHAAAHAEVRRGLLLAALLPLSAWAAVPTSNPHPDPEIDAAFDAVMARYRLPGLAVGVIEQGRVTYARTAGERVAGEGAAIDRQTLFKVASNTKAMTAAVLARLVDAGKLRWDDPVTRHLPQFRMHDPWVTRNMQVRDLLIHNSGLRAGAGDLMLWPEPNAFARADVIRGLAHLVPQYSFRSRYDYDNLLYIVAGEVAAAAGGAPYEDLVRREVFAPLGMEHCRVGAWRRAETPNLAQPHMRRGERNVPVREDGETVPATTMAAAGGVRCSLDDMLAWVRAWVRPQSAPGWLSDEQRRAMTTAQMPMPLSERMREWDGSRFSAYGYGWRLADVDGTYKVSHTGTLMGMYSAVTWLPDLDVGFVILSNGEASDARTVLSQVLVKRFTRPQAKLDVAHYAALLERERAQRPAASRAPDTSSRRPLPAAGFGQAGVYRDPWFGEASICPDGGGVRFRAHKSPLLDGRLMRVGERLLVDWADPSVDAEAWLDFAPASAQGKIALTMAKVDPDADFSYDYEDLRFERVRGCD